MAHRLFQVPRSLLCTGTVVSLFAGSFRYEDAQQDCCCKMRFSNVSSGISHADNTTDVVSLEAKLLAVKPALDKIYQQHFDKHHIPGLLYGVTLHGKLVMHGSIGSISASPTSRHSGQLPCRHSSMFRIASMTKSFTALAIVQLRDRGSLNLSDPVSKYVPEVKQIAPLGADSPPLTIGHLLTMQGGFPQDDPWGDRLLDMSDEDFSRLLTSGLILSNPTGTVYEYSNLGYAILGLVIKNISNMPYQDYITKNIFLPLGMENTVFDCDQVRDAVTDSGSGSTPCATVVPGYRYEEGRWKEEPMLRDGAFGAMGGILTTLDDFVKYMAFHQAVWQQPHSTCSNETPEHSTTICCPASVREMHFPWNVDGIFFEKPSAMRPLVEAGTEDSGTVKGKGGRELVSIWSEAYGYGLKSCRDLEGIRWIRHAGGLPGFSSEWRFLPNHGVGLVVFSNRTYCSTGEANHAAMTHLLRHGVLASHAPPFRAAGGAEGEEELPTPTSSDMLSCRALQLLRCLQTDFDDAISQDIFAPNFFQDKPKHLWLADTEEIRRTLRPSNVESTGKMIRENNLRGEFVVTGRGTLQTPAGSKVKLGFTMTPENPPRIQTLRVIQESI